MIKETLILFDDGVDWDVVAEDDKLENSPNQSHKILRFDKILQIGN